MSSYRVAPIFLIRLAGVPFDTLDALATPRAIVSGRKLAEFELQQLAAAEEAERFFESRVRLLSAKAYSALRIAVRSRKAPAPVDGEQPSIFTNYAKTAAASELARAELSETLEQEVNNARSALVRHSRHYISPYLVFGAESVRNLLQKQLAAYPETDASLPARHNAARKVEQSLILYLQRLAAKNDTFSQFGPSSWGCVSDSTPGVVANFARDISQREVFVERWTAHALADAINSDEDVFAYLRPRLHPRGRLAGSSFRALDVAQSLPLNPRELEIVRLCDGTTPVSAITDNFEEVRSLVSREILRCAIEVPALDAHAVKVLEEDVAAWPDVSTRHKWLSILQPFLKHAANLKDSRNNAERSQILDEARAQLGAAGATQNESKRFLYSASNVIGEECYRASNFIINDAVLDKVTDEADLWIDFWRDTYAFVASRVATSLREIFAHSVESSEAIPLPAFLAACERARLSLTGPGLVAMASLGFAEVKAAFYARLKPHITEAHYQLTRDDCHVVRNHFDYPKFDEYTYPSADLQLSAKSFSDVARGTFQWIIGELHPPVAMLHHGFYWACPDKNKLSSGLAKTVFGRPNIHFGIFAADFTSHTTVRFFDALPDLTYFVAPQRGNPKWQTVRPADAEVFIDESTGDVGVRTSDSHKFLGSFARNWIIPLGFHPFHFGMSPHSPRLMCGNVVVQRRAWTVREEELRPGNFNGISRDLVLAIEELRASRDLPRYVYIRPTEQALRRSGAEGRDKDTKPVFIDLESYLFLEIFHRWLKKAGEIEVTEMLPDPDHLCWQEADGRRTFELRTLIVPRT